MEGRVGAGYCGSVSGVSLTKASVGSGNFAPVLNHGPGPAAVTSPSRTEPRSA